MKDKMPTDELIEACQHILETSKYNLERTKHPGKKRQEQNCIRFYGSIISDLTELQQLKNDK